MALELVQEVHSAYIKFDQAEREWLNRLDDLNTHYETAKSNFLRNLPTGKTGGAASEVLDIGSNIVIGGFGLAGAPAVVAVPVVMGLKKLASFVDGEIKPPDPDTQKIQRKLFDIRRSFKDTTEHLGKQIVKLEERAKMGSGKAHDQGIRKSISTMLLSPIWYPPDRTHTRNPGIAKALEMRLWFNYFNELMKLPPGQVLMATNYDKMFNRFKEIGFAPMGIEFVRFVTLGRNAWIPKGDLWENLKKFRDYGNKNMNFEIGPKYPQDVERYIEMMKLKMAISMFTQMPSISPSDLEFSGLTWSNVSL